MIKHFLEAGHSTGSFLSVTLERHIITLRHWNWRKIINFLLQINLKRVFDKVETRHNKSQVTTGYFCVMFAVFHLQWSQLFPSKSIVSCTV